MHVLRLLVTWLLIVGVAQAEERILSFHSDLTVHADASVTVIETIRVRAEGDDIRRGIYRDIPTRYVDRLGSRRHVRLDVVSVMRGGIPEKYEVSEQGQGVRIRIGAADVLLDTGTYTYTITYETQRQVGYFEAFDEIYWNVTGNDWAFPIDEASALVSLPPGGSVIARAAYTARLARRRPTPSSSVDELGRAASRTTRPSNPMRASRSLPPAQGDLGGADGTRVPHVVHRRQPCRAVRRCAVRAGAALLHRCGPRCSDPARGTVRPFRRRQTISPAMARFVRNMGFDDKVFTAAIVSLATKGYLKIVDEDQVIRLDRINPNAEGLHEDEALVGRELFESRDSITLERVYRFTLVSTIHALRQHLEGLAPKYFESNRGPFFGGLLLTVVGALMLALTSSSSFESLFLAFWLTGWTCGVVVLLLQTAKLWLAALRQRSVGTAFGAVFMTLFSVPFVLAEIMVTFLFSTEVPFTAMLLFGATVALSPLFSHLLKAPTAAGSDQDRLDGFKMSLQLAQDEGPFRACPDPERFESFLAYALALDVETTWSQKLRRRSSYSGT